MSNDMNFTYNQPVMAIPVIDKLESVSVGSVGTMPVDMDMSGMNVYDNNDPGPWIADDAIEKSSNIFSQV